MINSTSPIRKKSVTINFISFLIGCVVLQACNPNIASDNPAQDTQPVQTQAVNDSITMPPTDKYLFVEIWVEISGVGEIPNGRVDKPGYEYDPLQGTLNIFRTPKDGNMSPSDWGYVGEGQSRHEAAGGGGAGSLSILSTLPYTTTIPVFNGEMSEYAEIMETLPVTIVSIYADGSLVVNIGGADSILESGQQWQHSKKVSLDTERFSGSYEITSSITNYGWNERVRIK